MLIGAFVNVVFQGKFRVPETRGLLPITCERPSPVVQGLPDKANSESEAWQQVRPTTCNEKKPVNEKYQYAWN